MEYSFFSSRANQTLGTLALVALVVALTSYAVYTIKQSKYLYTGPVTISVSGMGEVLAVPDIGQFSFSVNAKSSDATEAQEMSGTKVNDILAYLKSEGVEDVDVKASGYNLYPKYRYDITPCPEGNNCPRKQIEDGFEVNQTISVKVRNLDEAGNLIAGVGSLGATNISGLNFTIDDTDVLKAEARTEAIADARAKARVLASELGVRITKMVGYYEDENRGGMPYYGGMADMAMESSVKSSSAPVLPTGENSVNSKVTITYQVR